jgi:hypothetical protein
VLKNQGKVAVWLAIQLENQSNLSIEVGEKLQKQAAASVKNLHVLVKS